MKIISKWSLLLAFAMVLAGVQLLTTTRAHAQSSYFTSRGCIDCHSAPTAATCAGCHQHSGTLTATKNKTTAYAPGETVTITMTGTGARTGWIGARLYDQNGVEIARSTGNQSGMGGSTLYPAVLSAPAPATPGTYTWKMAYFGNLNGTGTRDVHGEKTVNVAISVAAPADTTAPTVGAFTLPATSTSLTVPVSSLTASDNVAVTGYLVTTSATAPLASAAGWSAAAPTSVTAPAAGTVTFYAWAKDAAGNVSAARSASVVITLPDTTLPVVGAFTLPATSTSLTVPVTSLSASDNVAVTGYLVTTSATKPLATAAGWSAAAPTSVTAPAAGTVTFYAWAKDAAGNVSAARSASVVITITVADITAPVVGAFTLPATSTSLTVPVTSLTASDNIAVTGYLVTTSATAPLASTAGWSAAAPTSVTAPAAGTVTFYAWAKDAAGNISLSRNATVVITITVADTTAPTVSAFTLPATSASLTVPVSSLTASDNIAVTGYLVTTSATKPLATAAGWSATVPTSVTAPADGAVTFYAWAKDAAGNVSLSRSASVTITLPAETIAPTVDTFTLPATSTSLTVPVTSLTASDNVAVTGYRITTSATAPLASAAGWSATAPTSATATAAGTVTFYAWAKDAAGNVSAARSASVVITITVADTTAPVVGAFTLPATSTSLTVPVSSLAASDNVAVTGYLISRSYTKPLASAPDWSATAPASVTSPVAGYVTFYAWAKDASGNVSAARSARVNITLPAETVAPSINDFTLPATSTKLIVPITSLTASDNVAVTGYRITTSAVQPLATAAGWSTLKPTRVIAPAAGTVTFYAWAKDASGNVSEARSATVTIDNLVPKISTFTLPAASTDLTVPVTSLAATDNAGITGYLINRSALKPLATAEGWSATAPTTVTSSSVGYVTFYAWAKDAVGNVSLARSARVKVSEPVAPTVNAFTLPATSTSLIVPIASLTASDNVAVTGYRITTSAVKPLATAAGWSTVRPTRVIAPAAGTVTFYAWAKDASGNVADARSATVTIDNLVPKISTFTLPTTSDSLAVPVTSLTATDNIAVTGYLINRSATKPPATAEGWSASVPDSVIAPAAGYVTFYAWVKDAVGNVSAARSARVNVTQAQEADTIKPVLTVSTLANGTITRNQTLNVSGQATDNVALESVTVNGTAVPVTAGGTFSTALTLVEGANTITVEAVDTAGNRSVMPLTITYQPLAPELAVIAPVDNLVTAQDILDVSGTVIENSSVTVSVNGKNPQIASISGTTFSASVYLAPGLNTVAIAAVDPTGNQSNAKRTVIYDNGNPTLAITEPGEDKTTGDPAVTLKGKVADSLSAVTVKITMDGKVFTPVVNDGNFAQKLSFTTAKQYTIVVTATDAAGNSVSTSRNVIYKGEGDD